MLVCSGYLQVVHFIFKDLSKLVKSLATVTDLEEVKRKVRQLWKDGQLEKSQAAKVIRRWRSWQWQKKQKESRVRPIIFRVFNEV